MLSGTLRYFLDLPNEPANQPTERSEPTASPATRAGIISSVMRRYKSSVSPLRTGTGRAVRDPRQALAIALALARRVPERP